MKTNLHPYIPVKMQRARKKVRTRESYMGKTEESRDRQKANLKYGKNSVKGQHLSWRERYIAFSGLSVDAKYPDETGYPDFSDIIEFINHHYHVKETKRPIGEKRGLLPWQEDNLFSIFIDNGLGGTHEIPKLAVCGACKKSGKSALAGAIGLYYLCCQPMSENFILASDYEQGRGIIFKSIANSIRMHPFLWKKLKVTKDEINNVENGASIKVLSCDSSIAGVRQNLVLIDELWAFTSILENRVLDEITTNPLGSLAVVVTYAGFQEDCHENNTLYRYYSRGLDIEAGIEPPDPQFYFNWKTDYEGIHWVTDKYLAHQRKILSAAAFSRFHQNEFVSSVNAFIEAEILDCCFNIYFTPGGTYKEPVCVGIDASVKWDASALACVGNNSEVTRGLRLIDHRIFEPKGKVLDYKSTIRKTLLEWNEKYQLVTVFFDPYQLVYFSQTMLEFGIRMKEYPQSVSNMVKCCATLKQLLYTSNIQMYFNDTIRRHILSASEKEHTLGTRIVKTSSSKHIDFAISLAMACQAGSDKWLKRGGKQSTVYIGDDSFVPDIMAERIAQMHSEQEKVVYEESIVNTDEDECQQVEMVVT